ncbi:AAA domain-containing protein [Streptomyces sp. NPDC058746]|uniref:AAA domain-containing protein n=1 Tax=Streptomyces sp. NPDC058746 TaxID=3346622 RepID=UPI0036B9CCFF
MSVPAAVPEDLARVRQIFRYLAEVGESRTKPVRNHDGARHLLWFSELPGEFASFLTEAVPGDTPLWLSAQRPVRPEAPAASNLLAPWLNQAEIRDSDRTTAPALREQTALPVVTVQVGGDVRSDRTQVTLDDFHQRDELLAEHRAWTTRWLRWAEHDRTVKPAARVYDRLYRIHEDVTDLGESYELVVGIGYLTWSSGGEAVRRHLITCRAVIALDPDTGTLSVGPDPEHGAPTLEESMLDAEQKARAGTRESIRQDLETSDATDPGQHAILHQALRTWVIAAHEAGRYESDPTRHQSTATGRSVPVVSFAPALLLRERTRRSMLEALQGVANRIEQGAEPTRLLRAIAGSGASAPLDAGHGVEPGRTADGAMPQELYFALPSNDEQRTIAERLRDRDLVVVQGPPGTGKTHTIANLVTDLLAHGQRVLITSHTARALKVLKDKLPESIRELCVSRTDDLTAQQELEQSIRAILHRQGEFSARTYRRAIESHEAKLRSARSVQATALKNLRALREQETYRHGADIGDYQGTLARIAQRLNEERPRYAWIGAVPGTEPLVDRALLTELRRASLAFTTRHRSLAASVTAGLPERATLLSGEEFAAAVDAVSAAEADLGLLREDPRSARLDDAISGLDPAAQERLASALEAFAAAVATTADEPTTWLATLRDEVLAGRDLNLRDRLERESAALAEAQASASALGAALVSGLEEYDIPGALGLATVLRDSLAAGEKLRGPLGLKTRLRKAVGDFPETARVDGQPLQTAAAAETVLHRIRLERNLQETENESGAPGSAWQPPARRLTRLRENVAALTRLGELADRRGEAVRAAAAAPGLAGASWQDGELVSTVSSLLKARATQRAAQAPREKLADTLSALRAAAHRRGAAVALDRARAAAECRDPKAYAEAVGEVDELREALTRKHACDEAYSAVARTMPELADRIEAEAESAHWDTRLPDYEAAWAWSVWDARMRELTDPAAEEKELALLAQADADIRISLERLAADKAWYSCLSRLTDDQAVALTSYQQSVKRLGKGTGKYAPRYRRQARESLQASQSAVPAWIMPLHQVTDTVPTDRAGRFDVVIIDEASQSGPEALLLAWLGAKIIVVGDDKQVSPANVGIDHDELFVLQSRLLSGLPDFRRNLFTPTASFFDIASGLAGGRGRLMLREHFRCMPEIIGFSNELCYGGRLQPLRQYGAERLAPLKAVHVADGYVEGTGQKQVNRAEAERLVEAVFRCVEDPAYRGRTMGVITLLGAAQKFLIEDLLSDLPLDERQRRRLRVGNAEEFQGDERDIVFISAVTSLTGSEGPRRVGPYSSALAQQHINVAASRARDQVWLFHSFGLSDLGESDLRRAYLDWFSRPAEAQDGAGLGDVSPDQPHEAFDSLFEQRVFLALRARGYRVRPQYPAGRYRIDLVVEGGTRRLAVECDGDAFHTEENADEDAARQRELERVGWTFVRIRGSRFFLDPEKALEPLWAELDRLGIGTAGRGDAHVVVPAAPDHAAPTEAVDPAPPEGPFPPDTAPAPQERVRTVVNAQAGVPVPQAPQIPEPGVRPGAGEAVAWTTEPHGFRTVARIERSEVNTAQHALSMRRSVPNVEEPTGKARFIAASGTEGEDMVELFRDRASLVHLTRDEVQAAVRASVARTDIPVLVDGRQTALIRYHGGSRQGPPVELMRPAGAQGKAAGSPVKAVPAQPRDTRRPAAEAERAAPSPAEGRDRRIKAHGISLTAYRRVQKELDRVRDELEKPAPEVVAVDSSSWQAQQGDRGKRERQLKDRKEFLRTVLDQVEVDSAIDEGGLVTPGCLVGLEDADQQDGITIYEIALSAGGEAERLSPYSPLGQALMWRETGDTVEYVTETGVRLGVIIRFVDG